MRNIFRSLALVAALALAPSLALAQGFVATDGTLNGHTKAAGLVPVAVGCTLTANSNDQAGLCTTSAASGSITFSRTWGVAPFCMIIDADATSTVSMPVYTVSATVITLTTIITAHKLFYWCVGTQSSS